MIETPGGGGYGPSGLTCGPRASSWLVSRRPAARGARGGLAGAAAARLGPVSGTVEAIASSALGRRVTIEGPIGLSLLPEPVLAADRVNVGEAAAPRGRSFRVQALRLRVALAPLLCGSCCASWCCASPSCACPGRCPRMCSTAWLSWMTSLSARMEDGTLTVGDVVS